METYFNLIVFEYIAAKQLSKKRVQETDERTEQLMKTAGLNQTE